jgi:L1 cell adhesion molecule like protein
VEDWHALQAYYQVIWQELYSPKSARDKCSLYQLRNLIDRRDVTSDPKGTLHACQSFLKVVIETEVLAALAGTLGLRSLGSDTDVQTLLGEGSLPMSSAGRVQAITSIAERVLSCISYDHCVDPTSTVELQPFFPGNDAGNYSSKLLSMGLFAWNFEDAIREGDGDRIIRMWKFLLLFFKQTQKSKYSIEATRLLSDVHVNLSADKRYELRWNRTCSLNGGSGNNKPLDLALEHLNREFKSNIGNFHSHLTEKSVQKTSHAAPIVEHLLVNFDQQSSVRQDSGYHPTPSFDRDRMVIME